MGQRRYGWDTGYSTNVFGADEHYVVTLYKLNSAGTKWRPIQSWSFSTFVSSRIAHSRGERRITKLQSVYGAEAI